MITGDQDRSVPCSCLLDGNDDDDHGDDNDDNLMFIGPCIFVIVEE